MMEDDASNNEKIDFGFLDWLTEVDHFFEYAKISKERKVSLGEGVLKVFAEEAMVCSLVWFSGFLGLVFMLADKLVGCSLKDASCAWYLVSEGARRGKGTPLSVAKRTSFAVAILYL
ncbi:hypothetical protein GH714_000091 [Hevea brasiliensis]|uniref:Uncharacterized protein n=1 Tax=Hevea brasiliensis TaxID=3981 RepID=A0A6A6L823_HEVBR|nr:hypothetical protein GH714_000091 [Hevea brasiliensis]